MQEITYETKEVNHSIVIGYEDEYHVVINKITKSIAYYNGKGIQLTRGLEYPTIEEAVVAGKTMLNTMNALL